MSQFDGGVAGETPRSEAMTVQQVQNLHTGLASLVKRSSQDEREGPNMSMEGYSYEISGDLLPSEISTHFMGPEVEDPSVLSEPEFELFIACPEEDEFAFLDDRSDHDAFWVSFYRIQTKPNGTEYRSSIDYYLKTDGRTPPMITMHRLAELEEYIPPRVYRIAEQIWRNVRDGNVAALAENEVIVDGLIGTEDMTDVRTAIEELDYVELVQDCLAAGLLTQEGAHETMPRTPAQFFGEDVDTSTQVGFDEANAVSAIISRLGAPDQRHEQKT